MLKKWLWSLTEGGPLLEIPTVRLCLGKFSCFGLEVINLSLEGGRLQEVVAHGGSAVMIS